MEFNFFLNSCSKIEKKELKGLESHLELAPPNRDQYTPNYTNKFTRRAGVMAIVFSKKGQAHLALILRTKYKGAHSGEISLPGGKFEINDATILETAYREVAEEIGIESTELIFLKTLTPIYIPTSNFSVSPFLAYAPNIPTFKLEKMEVDTLIELPLSHLLDTKSITSFEIQIKEKEKVIAPGFAYQNYKIWGATAMILNELKQLLLSSMLI